jgi:hypothetical protein
MAMTALLVILAEAASPSTPESWFVYLIDRFGPVGALGLAFVWAGYKGWIRWGREVQREQDERTRQELEWAAERIKRDAEWQSRLDASEKERSLWRDLVIKQQHVTQRAVETAKQAIDQSPTKAT